MQLSGFFCEETSMLDACCFVRGLLLRLGDGNGSRFSEGVAQSDVSTCLAFTHLMGAVVHRVLTTARPLFTAT